jgi:hypothetical protein
MTVRYLSNREELFDVELVGGQTSIIRLKEFVKDPTLVLRTDNELIIIPSTAIESISLSLSELEPDEYSLDGVRKASRVQ